MRANGVQCRQVAWLPIEVDFHRYGLLTEINQPPCRLQLRGGFLSSALTPNRVCAEHQTGDCQERVEQFNVTHQHHLLRICTPSRRNHPVDLPAYKAIVSGFSCIGKKKTARKNQVAHRHFRLDILSQTRYNNLQIAHGF